MFNGEHYRDICDEISLIDLANNVQENWQGRLQAFRGLTRYLELWLHTQKSYNTFALVTRRGVISYALIYIVMLIKDRL